MFNRAQPRQNSRTATVVYAACFGSLAGGPMPLPLPLPLPPPPSEPGALSASMRFVKDSFACCCMMEALASRTPLSASRCTWSHSKSCGRVSAVMTQHVHIRSEQIASGLQAPGPAINIPAVVAEHHMLSHMKTPFCGSHTSSQYVARTSMILTAVVP